MFKRDKEVNVELFSHDILSQIANSSVEDQCINDVLSNWDLYMKSDRKNEDEN